MSDLARPLQESPAIFRRLELGMIQFVDVVEAGSLLFLMAPLFFLIALAIRLDTAGPALFRQSRTGFGGQTFLIYKFRSMTVLENGSHVAQARRGDQRITRVGAFLRRTSLDELPQLLNVLAGEMSLVGPRPHALAHDHHYRTLIANYDERFLVRPGMTGWAQIHGERGETETLDRMKRRIELDISYVRNIGFLRYLRILFLTPVALARNDAF